jgi:hypothetical protein
LELPPHIVEVEYVITIVGSCCTSNRRSISFFWQAAAPEIGGSDLVEFS